MTDDKTHVPQIEGHNRILDRICHELERAATIMGLFDAAEASWHKLEDFAIRIRFDVGRVRVEHTVHRHQLHVLTAADVTKMLLEQYIEVVLTHVRREHEDCHHNFVFEDSSERDDALGYHFIKGYCFKCGAKAQGKVRLGEWT